MPEGIGTLGGGDWPGGSVGLIYIDDVLIVGRGKGRMRGQALRAAVELLAQRAPWSWLRAWCGSEKTWT